MRDAYRRCVWTQRGVKRPVWRCVSRLDYGKKFCTQSPTLDEEPLQQAILPPSTPSCWIATPSPAVTAVMEWELAPMLGESMSLADIDRALEELSSRFNSLLAEAQPTRQRTTRSGSGSCPSPPPVSKNGRHSWRGPARSRAGSRTVCGWCRPPWNT